VKIRGLIATPGVGGWYSTDLEAIRRGAKPDVNGFLYEGEPVTPGFTAIRQPAWTVCLQLLLDDGLVAYGDCATMTFSGRGGGRDGPIGPEGLIGLIERAVTPHLVGLDVERFRPNDELLAGLQVDGQPLPPAARYGLSQALLDATAKARRLPMACVLAEEWDIPLATKPVALNLQTGPDWERGIDKIILRRGAAIHTRQPHNPRMFAEIPDFLTTLRDRLQRLAPADYRPRIHIDFYGLMEGIFDGDTARMVEHIAELERLASPYVLLVGDMVELSTQEAQIETMARVRRGMQRLGLASRTVAEEHCLTVDDHRAFLDAGAANYQKIRPLDLGNLGAMMDIARLIKVERASAGVGIYLSGSGAETQQAGLTRVHLALAANVDVMLGSPSMDVDGAHTLATNEMTKLFALLPTLKA
jgi:methylaspartate ammonia-lyase